MATKKKKTEKKYFKEESRKMKRITIAIHLHKKTKENDRKTYLYDIYPSRYQKIGR